MPRRQPADSVFTAIADRTRREILAELCAGERTAGELQTLTDASQSAFSQHLGVLRAAGLVRARREGRYRVYAVEPLGLAPIVSWMQHFDRFWDVKLNRLRLFLDKPRRREHRS